MKNRQFIVLMVVILLGFFFLCTTGIKIKHTVVIRNTVHGEESNYKYDTEIFKIQLQ